MPPARNIELKARLHDLAAARQTARRLATEFLGIHQQVDTYFHCPEGRLKLRETAILDPGATDSPLSAALAASSRSELIWYDRADDTQAKQSDYQLIEVTAARARQLKREMGIRVIVVKRREVFLHRNVRIHLDEVHGLGQFIEFEAVLGWGIDESAGQTQVSYLQQEFALAAGDLLSGSYADLLLAL
jgi:adenylate cyclase class IV